MNIPNDRYYVDTHEWALIKEDSILVGITDFAQEQLGDLVFVGDFKKNKNVDAGETVCIVESVKAASDIYAPVVGQVLEVNEQVVNNPELIQTQPYEAWLFKMRPKNIEDVKSLLTAKQYQSRIE